MDSVTDLNNIAGYMTLDSDLWIGCRYERLQLINLLAIQQRMDALERDLGEIVKYERNPTMGPTCTIRGRSSTAVFEELEKTIKAYGEAISTLSMIREAESPARRFVQSLTKQAPGSSFASSLHPRHLKADTPAHLFSVVTGTQSWLQRLVGKHARLGRVFQEKYQGDSADFIKYSEERLRNVEFGIIAACLCLVQLLPLLALTLVSSKTVRLAVIIVLVVFVSILNALFANTVRATNFGAIAAYSAIVVVFVSQNN